MSRQEAWTCFRRFAKHFPGCFLAAGDTIRNLRLWSIAKVWSEESFWTVVQVEQQPVHIDLISFKEATSLTQTPTRQAIGLPMKAAGLLMKEARLPMKEAGQLLLMALPYLRTRDTIPDMSKTLMCH